MIRPMETRPRRIHEALLHSYAFDQAKSEMKVQDIKPARTVDTSGYNCPVPIVEANRAIKSLQPGEVMELISTDIGSHMDISAWCERTGHQLLKMEEQGKTFRYFVRKRERQFERP